MFLNTPRFNYNVTFDFKDIFLMQKSPQTPEKKKPLIFIYNFFLTL